jgi:CARDB
MKISNRARIAGVVVTAALVMTPILAPTPVQAATLTLDLSTGIQAWPIFPEATYDVIGYTVTAVAERRQQVWDPELRRYIVEISPTAASNVVVRADLPSTFTALTVQGYNGFQCSLNATTVTCVGNIPATGTVDAVRIGALPPNWETRYAVTSVVDPNNVIAEYNETNNTATVTASANDVWS